MTTRSCGAVSRRCSTPRRASRLWALHLRNAVTGLDRTMRFGAGYLYAHDQPEALVEQQHLPDGLAGHRYYEPSEQGTERAIAERLEAIRAEIARRG